MGQDTELLCACFLISLKELLNKRLLVEHRGQQVLLGSLHLCPWGLSRVKIHQEEGNPLLWTRQAHPH